MTLDISILLICIALVETGNNQKAIGKAGERSKYQITRAVWREHSTKPFTEATNDPAMATIVAVSHINHCIVPFLQRNEFPVNAESVARCWKAGCRGFTLGRGIRYGERVNNLYQSRVKRI